MQSPRPGRHPAQMSIQGKIRNVPFLRQGDVAQNTHMKTRYNREWYGNHGIINTAALLTITQPKVGFYTQCSCGKASRYSRVYLADEKLQVILRRRLRTPGRYFTRWQIYVRNPISLSGIFNPVLRSNEYRLHRK